MESVLTESIRTSAIASTRDSTASTAKSTWTIARALLASTDPTASISSRITCANVSRATKAKTANRTSTNANPSRSRAETEANVSSAPTGRSTNLDRFSLLNLSATTFQAVTCAAVCPVSKVPIVKSTSTNAL